MTDQELIARLRGWPRDIQEGSKAIWAIDQDLKQAADRISARAAEIERLRGALKKAVAMLDKTRLVLAEWEPHPFPVLAQVRTTLAELTGSTTVKDSLTTEDEKQSHEWKCPIDYSGCRKNCGSYGCGN